MPALLGLITSGFASVYTFMAAQIGARLSIMLVLVSVYVAAAGTFAVSITALINGVYNSTPALVQDAISMLPANTATCISVCIAAEVAAYIYRQIVIIAGIKARV